MKILHIPTDLGMRAYSLCRAEQELGQDSRMVVMSPGVHVSGSMKALKSSNIILTGTLLLWEFIKGFQADVIMANAGSSLIDSVSHNVNLFDIPLYALFNKRIIVTYQGCDIRICETCPVRVYLPNNIICPNAKDNSYTKADAIKMKRFKIWSEHADYIFGITPDLCLVDGVTYTPHAKYIDSSLLAYDTPAKKVSRKVRIGHMVRRNIRGKRIDGVEYLKGTPLIEEIMALIEKEYSTQVEFVPIDNLSWKQCLMTIASCDVLVDQIISGWYGGISVEAALMGTLPVAYIDDKLLKFVPQDMKYELPVFPLSDKEVLFDTLTDFVKNREKVRDAVHHCQRNALKYHDAKKIASHYIRDYYNWT